MSESKPVDLEEIEDFIYEITQNGGQCSQEFDNWSERHRNNWAALKSEVESLRERVKELAESIEHGCLRCGYVGPIPEPTKGDHP